MNKKALRDLGDKQTSTRFAAEDCAQKPPAQGPARIKFKDATVVDDILIAETVSC